MSLNPTYIFSRGKFKVDTIFTFICQLLKLNEYFEYNISE